MISVRLVKFLGSGSWSGLSRRKRRGTPDLHLLKDSWTAFTRLCRRKASVRVRTYPMIVEIQSAVSAADQDRIIGAPEDGRRAIAFKTVSTGAKSISLLSFLLDPFFQFWIEDKGIGVMNLVATHYISCTTLQLHITYGLHLPSFTALTHSHPPLHQSHSCPQSLINPDCFPHTCISFSHTHLSSTLPFNIAKSLFLPRLTFLSVLPFPLIATSVVWPRTALPWNSEPVLVTSTPAWYCLRLCSASDIPVIARWPLPVWFCLCLNKYITARGSTRLWPVFTIGL